MRVDEAHHTTTAPGAPPLFSGAVTVVATAVGPAERSPSAEEERLAARWQPRRAAQFLAGRRSAHAALRALGVAEAPLLVHPGGAPLWPPGVAGSIGHCDHLAVAAVAPRSVGVVALGIDVEEDEPLPGDVLALVCTGDERRRLVALPGGEARWATVVFSAKECIYKCLAPMTGRFLEFDDVDVVLDVGPGGESGPWELVDRGRRLLGAELAFRGRWGRSGSHVWTGLEARRSCDVGL